jgi:competence protein ComEC
MKRVGTIIFAVLIGLLWTVTAQTADLHVRVLDVAEGQAVLLQRGSRAMLIDSGHAGVARDVLRRMDELQIEALDYLILTHLHPDHASGLFRIHEAFPQAVVMDNCYPVHAAQTPDMMRWTYQALQKVENRQCLTAGDRIDWSGTVVEVLWPLVPPARNSDPNATSLVLKIRHKDKTLLIMGDAGHAAEKHLLAAGQLSPVELLLVGHHGADDASGEEFLRKVLPKKAVISTNKNNFRGYPSSLVLNRLEALGVAVYKTYQDGEVSFLF